MKSSNNLDKAIVVISFILGVTTSVGFAAGKPTRVCVGELMMARISPQIGYGNSYYPHSLDEIEAEARPDWRGLDRRP